MKLITYVYICLIIHKFSYRQMYSLRLTSAIFSTTYVIKTSTFGFVTIEKTLLHSFVEQVL